MTLRPVLRYPDPRLSTPADPVVAFDQALADLAEDLAATMLAAPGIGIAGPHIGVMRRILVIQLAADGPRWVCVNPQITATSAVTVRHTESSIALPGIAEEVERPDKVSVRYQDLTGASQSIEAAGLLGVCLQHEIDQLDGIFWLKRLSRLKRERLLRRAAKRA